MRKLRILIVALLIIPALLLAFQPAKAATAQWYTFTRCTTNSPLDIGSQLLVYIEPYGSSGGYDYARFTFYNNVPPPPIPVVSEVYFLDGTILGPTTIQNGPGVDFQQGATPASPPGCGWGNATKVFIQSASAVQPSPFNGIGYQEWLALVFRLEDSSGNPKTFDEIIAQLNSGVLDIAVHVQQLPDASGGNGQSDSYQINGPTAIKLDSFSAQAKAGSVTLNWRTGTEIDNVGFNLYRAGADAGARTLINRGLISAKGEGTSGASYSFVDKPGYGTYYYWLEDVDMSGKTTLHGPARVTVSPFFLRPLFRPALPVAR